MRLFQRTWGSAAFAALMLGAFFTIVATPDAYADEAGSKAFAMAQCTPGTGGINGAIWADDRGVVVNPGQTYADVRFYSSAYTCPGGASSYYQRMYAAGIQPLSGGSPYEFVYGNEVYRGATAPRGQWSNNGGSYLVVRLNLARLPEGCSVHTITRYFRSEGPPYQNGTRWPEGVQICRKTVNRWTIVGSTSVSPATAYPGQTVNWQHSLKNNGPDATSSTIYSNLGVSGFSNGWATGVAGQNFGAGIRSGTTFRTSTSNPSNTRYVITQNDVGKNLCQWIQWDPVNHIGGRNGRSAQKCVTVPYEYGLTPQIKDISTIVSPGSTVQNLNGTITNSGRTKSRDATTWRISQITVKPGKAIPHETESNRFSDSAPCTYFKTADTDCSDRPLQGSNTGSIGVGTRTINLNGNPVIGDLPVGTRVCFATSVRDRAHNSAQWAHSKTSCVTLGKYPKVQVHGGDLAVARGRTATTAQVATSTTEKTADMFGSWVEYGIFAPNTVVGLGSSSAYANPAPIAGLCSYAKLSFTNRKNITAPCATNDVGGYRLIGSVPAVAASFPGGTPLGGTFKVSDVAPGSGLTIYQAAGNVTVEGGTLPAGASVVIKSTTGVVTIASDITYEKATNYQDQTAIPQLVIAANAIDIKSKVKNVDAWLVASGSRGTLNTCSTLEDQNQLLPVDARLTDKLCGDILTVNGPVIADRLLLRRTGGSGVAAASGQPAEVFNLRPDAYAWAQTQARRVSTLSTVYQVEIPVRF